MDCLTNGKAEEWERFSMQIPDFPHGKDHFIHREWIINAIDCGSLASVEWMLSKNVNLHFIDDEGYSVLHTCIERDNADKYEILQLLIDSGADVNVGNNLASMAINSWTPLHLAAARNDLDAIKILLENGADSSLKTIIDNYCNAEEEATILGQNEAADFIRNYQSAKKQKNKKTNQQKTKNKSTKNKKQKTKNKSTNQQKTNQQKTNQQMNNRLMTYDL
ncbi:MAG: ankyrin repeat domain-containing protein [Prevotellaceae bacterium]|nr:ankyrin repeat domain-containing protein [Prevotellaceae bacterium]